MPHQLYKCYNIIICIYWQINQSIRKWKFLPTVTQVIRNGLEVQILQVNPIPLGDAAALSASVLLFLYLDAAVESAASRYSKNNTDPYNGFVEQVQPLKL